MTVKRIAAVAAAAALSLAGPAMAADEGKPSTGDRLDLVEVKQKDAVVAGDFPGSFRIPGTEVSLRLYGWAELNWIHDFKGDNTDIDFATFPAYVPVEGTPEYERTGRDILTARTSRFGIQAATPTRYGPLGVKLEGDFINEPRTGGTGQYGSYKEIFTQQQTSSYGFRVRHAYGSFGGLLVGQTWGTFMDVDNSPETVDFNGPPGSTIIRQPMIRYSHATPKAGTFTVALENSSSYVLSDSDGLPLASSLSRIPDVVLRWDGSFGWGNVSLRGVGQEFRVKDGAGIDAAKYGWGAGATAFVKARGGKDFLSLAVTGGDGIGRYLNYIEGAIYDATVNEILVEKAWGVVGGYQLKPADWVRVNLVYGITRHLENDFTDHVKAIGFDSGRFGVNHQVQQAHLGAIFTPIANVDLGVEGIWAERETLAGEKGDLLRFNFMARYYVN